MKGDLWGIVPPRFSFFSILFGPFFLSSLLPYFLPPRWCNRFVEHSYTHSTKGCTTSFFISLLSLSLSHTPFSCRLLFFFSFFRIHERLLIMCSQKMTNAVIFLSRIGRKRMDRVTSWRKNALSRRVACNMRACLHTYSFMCLCVYICAIIRKSRDSGYISVTVTTVFSRIQKEL